MKTKMRSKILIVCIICTMAALFIQTVMFQRASARLIYEQAESESFHTLENMQNEIYTFIKNIESNMIEIYNNKEFLLALKNEENIEVLQEDYYRLAYSMGAETFATSDGVVSLYVYDIQDRLISTYRRAVTPKHNYPKDIYENPEKNNTSIVKRYVESDDTAMLITSYYNEYREKDIVRFVLKLYDSTSLNDKIGYIVCDIDSKVLEKIMEKYVTNEEMYIWLQPQGDRQLFAIGNLEEESIEYHQALSDSILKGKPEEMEAVVDNNRVLFQVSQTKYNLDAYSIMPQSILEENEKVLTQNLVLIATVTGLVMTLLYVYITRSLAKPLERMMKTIARIRGGETKLRVEHTAEDEIGQLGSEFNHMLDEIESLISQQYEDKLLVNKAEYKALQSQINPHFLYNTLDTMSSIASIQNCEIVSNLCQSLSNIFRYSLDIKHPYSTLAKEIVHLRNYIFVMNVRMREEVEYIFDIDDEVLQDAVPRISLQPLVENALNHGLKNKHGKKFIKIQARKEGDMLRIQVQDNGIGMDATEMNERLQKNDTAKVEEGNSIGVLNINARLKMVYGSDYGMRIESKVGEGTTVILEVPHMGEEMLYGKENL